MSKHVISQTYLVSTENILKKIRLKKCSQQFHPDEPIKGISKRKNGKMDPEKAKVKY